MNAGKAVERGAASRTGAQTSETARCAATIKRPVLATKYCVALMFCGTWSYSTMRDHPVRCLYLSGTSPHATRARVKG